MKRAVLIALFLAACTPVSYDISPVVYLPFIVNQSTNSLRGVGSTYSQCEYMDGEWYYNWGMSLPDCGIESVPMLWDETFIGLPIFATSKWLMGFNEPDVSSQSDISPQMAAVLWKDVESIYSDKMLVSPSVLDLSWLNSWYEEYARLYGKPPRVDATGIHCYWFGDVRSAIEHCKTLTRNAIEWSTRRHIYQVWITEYAYLPCLGDSERFMVEMMLFFDSEPIVARDAWFQLSYMGEEPWAFGENCNTSLVDFYSGRLTELGKAYK